ncbi:MAG TPA: hypothetical protein VK656_02475 [Candidatus Acidoferrum sp.]|nr:hypothetical protein [Candidatus Acidoferrum sp.]
MEPRRHHERELVVLAVTIVGLSRLLDGPLVWVVAGLLLAAVWLGTRQVLSEGALGYAPVPLEAPIVPGVAAIAALGGIRLVPLGLAVVPALAAAGLLLNLALRQEGKVHDRPSGMTSEDRTAIFAIALVSAFLGFVGVASMVVGGLAEPGPGGSDLGPPVTEGGIVTIAIADAFIAGLLGFRFSAARLAGARDALWAAGTYAAAIAIAAGVLRAIAIPRLLFPALLVLVFYLWDTVRGSAPSLRRDPRFIWQSVLLAVLAVAVVAWNLGLRGS